MSGRRCSQLQQIGLDGIWVVVSSPVWWVQLRKQEYRPQGECDNNNGGPGPHTAQNLIHTDGTTHFLTSSCPPAEPTRRLVVTAQAHQPPANLSQDLISLLSEGPSTSQLLQQQQNGARPSMMSLLSTLLKEQRTTSLRFCERGDKTTRSTEIPTSRITLANLPDGEDGEILSSPLVFTPRVNIPKDDNPTLLTPGSCPLTAMKGFIDTTMHLNQEDHCSFLDDRNATMEAPDRVHSQRINTSQQISQVLPLNSNMDLHFTLKIKTLKPNNYRKTFNYRRFQC